MGIDFDRYEAVRQRLLEVCMRNTREALASATAKGRRVRDALVLPTHDGASLSVRSMAQTLAACFEGSEVAGPMELTARGRSELAYSVAASLLHHGYHDRFGPGLLCDTVAIIDDDPSATADEPSASQLRRAVRTFCHHP